MVVSLTRTAIGIAAQRALMQHFDLGALDKPEFEQAPLELCRLRSMGAVAGLNGMDMAAESPPRQTEWRALLHFRRRRAVGHNLVPHVALFLMFNWGKH